MSWSFARGLTTGVAIAGVVSVGLYEKFSREKELVPEENARQKLISLHGLPTKPGTERVLTNHILYYDHAKRVPLWVQEHITAENMKGTANRSFAKFRGDPQIKELWRAHKADYHESGYSRGHMAPAANHKSSQEDMNDTFLLSNIVPQDYNNNANMWARIELHCRMLTEKFKNVWVTTGPAFVPNVEENSTVMKHEMVGKTHVSVPTHLYKVVLAEDESGQKSMASFLVPNYPIGYEKKLEEFQLPLKNLEWVVGFNFFPDIDRSNVSDLCQDGHCQMISPDEFKLYTFEKILKKSKNLQHLNKTWEKMKEQNLSVPEEMKNLYESKKKVFLSEQKGE